MGLGSQRLGKLDASANYSKGVQVGGHNVPREPNLVGGGTRGRKSPVAYMSGVVCPRCAKGKPWLGLQSSRCHENQMVKPNWQAIYLQPEFDGELQFLSSAKKPWLPFSLIFSAGPETHFGSQSWFVRKWLNSACKSNQKWRHSICKWFSKGTLISTGKPCKWTCHQWGLKAPG